MKKRYLGLVFIIYVVIIIYLLYTDKISNYLSSNMQIYLKIGIVPLFFSSLILLFNNHISYKFKISDFLLLVPIIFLVLSSDGRLSVSVAGNRSLSSKVKEKSTVDIEKQKKIDEILNDAKKDKKIVLKDDFEKVDFDVIDASYEELAAYITYGKKAEKYENYTIRVKGFAIKKADYLKEGYFAIGKYVISCCAADAEFSGFIVKENETVTEGSWYQIEGILRQGVDNEGYKIMYIDAINIKQIDEKDEKQFAYPCYYYDEYCSELTKYELEY